ncbi:Di-copper centre-containing protein [Annulohypoxylon maeteangense]|uniref:Di-copper centre-containing protein n=1 Tax=Annulohypoxylon maeteangense TaxID=1927788 RepID=UPI0020072C98|nr:Di-copper centre-containing protein [Annulohypoxylon maeteangense]KAI0886917.1 Di-copper centre-containing protein [Annulohypoxylon maeteangense]
MHLFGSSIVLWACAAWMSQSVLAGPVWWNTNHAGGIPMPIDFRKYQLTYQKNIRRSLGVGGCTNRNIAVRKSWDEIDDVTRTDYIRAVHCLAAKPPLMDMHLAPGAVNRLDDFTYIHINQTNFIHQSGYLLPWHRLFLWQIEKALREECGYKGTLPYWDVPRFSDDQTKSKIFDGSATSFGGNGAFVPHGPKKVILPGLAISNFSLPKPAGTGGGCITDGPFQNFKISLGPVAKEVIDPANKFGYEPNSRCLSRDFHEGSSKGVLNWANATAIVASNNIKELRNNVEKLWHLNSHTFVGAEAADPFSTPNDPVFYLLHAQIDRLWAIWQGQDLEQRTYAIDGNRTFLGLAMDYAPTVPPSLATIEDPMDMGLGWHPKTKEGMQMTAGGRCYIYE